MLKLARPDIKIIVTEPAGAALLSGKEWKPHKIQGWTPDFVPAVLDREVSDEIVPVDRRRGARRRARARARRKASSAASPRGGTFAAALKVAREGARRAR